jgi:glycosyltransferase involved in cell wall biosynthesis
MPSKLGDLLEIEKPLRTFSDKIHLHLLTGDLPSALNRLPEGQGTRLRELLADLHVTIHPFRDVPSLLALYRSGGVIISPRQLANPYNQSHTEWKITLGMAAGLPAIASPQPSYLDVAEIADHPKAVTICASDADWLDAFAEAMGDVDFEDRSRASLDVVQRHYSSSVVAKMHSREMLELLSK